MASTQRSKGFDSSYRPQVLVGAEEGLLGHLGGLGLGAEQPQAEAVDRALDAADQGLERGPVTAARGAHLGAVRHGLGRLGQDRPQCRRGGKPRGEQGGHVNPYARTRWAIAPAPVQLAACPGAGAAPSRKRRTLPQLLTCPCRSLGLFSGLCAGEEAPVGASCARGATGVRALAAKRPPGAHLGRTVARARGPPAVVRVRSAAPAARPHVRSGADVRGVACSSPSGAGRPLPGVARISSGGVLPGSPVEEPLHDQGRVAPRAAG